MLRPDISGRTPLFPGLKHGMDRALLPRVPERPEKLPVPRRCDALPRRVGAGLVGPRSYPCVALLADVPVLPVGLVPEAHRVVGIEAGLPEGVGVEQPLAR